MLNTKKNWNYGRTKKYNTYEPYRYPIAYVNPSERSYKAGFKQVIEIPSLTSGSSHQYNSDNNNILESGIKRYGYFNGVTVLNQSDQDVRIDLDYSTTKSYLIPAGVQTSLDDVMFESFNIFNVGSGNIATDGLVKVYVIYERPTVREMI